MKKLASLLLALSLIFGLVSFSYAEEPYEVVIETVTFGAEYADIPAIEEAINAITVPAINVSVKILNVGIPEHAQKISMMIAGGEKIDLVMAGLTMPMVNMAVDGMLLPLDELLASQGADIQALLGDKLGAGKVNGALYAIPADAYPAQSGGFIYNKQMADELGITVPNPVTVDQLAEIFADIQAQKPQIYGTCFGNGETSNVLYDYNLENYGSAMYAYGVTLNQYENTDIVNLFATEQFREYALRHKDWVDKGYVPNDSMTSGILANEYIASGTVFGMTTNYSPLEAQLHVPHWHGGNYQTREFDQRIAGAYVGHPRHLRKSRKSHGFPEPDVCQCGCGQPALQWYRGAQLSVQWRRHRDLRGRCGPCRPRLCAHLQPLRRPDESISVGARYPRNL